MFILTPHIINIMPLNTHICPTSHKVFNSKEQWKPHKEKTHNQI